MARETDGRESTDSDTAEAINREQQDQGQAQDVAEEARRTGPGRPESRRGGPTNPAQILPDDVPDLVETMNAMVRSGHIDNSAYEGEPVHDDEEGYLGDTEADGDEPLEKLHEVAGAGDLVLDQVEDDGDDPLGAAASERGMADPNEDDELDDEDYEDDAGDDWEDEDDALDEETDSEDDQPGRA